MWKRRSKTLAAVSVVKRLLQFDGVDFCDTGQVAIGCRPLVPGYDLVGVEEGPERLLEDANTVRPVSVLVKEVFAQRFALGHVWFASHDRD